MSEIWSTRVYLKRIIAEANSGANTKQRKVLRTAIDACSISIMYCNNVVPIIRIWMERVYSIIFIYKINHVVSLRVVSLESPIVHGDTSGIGRQNNFT